MLFFSLQQSFQCTASKYFKDLHNHKPVQYNTHVNCLYSQSPKHARIFQFNGTLHCFIIILSASWLSVIGTGEDVHTYWGHICE